jgi:hypothetical protein
VVFQAELVGVCLRGTADEPGHRHIANDAENQRT